MLIMGFTDLLPGWITLAAMLGGLLPGLVNIFCHDTYISGPNTPNAKTPITNNGYYLAFVPVAMISLGDACSLVLKVTPPNALVRTTVLQIVSVLFTAALKRLCRRATDLSRSWVPSTRHINTHIDSQSHTSIFTKNVVTLFLHTAYTRAHSHNRQRTHRHTH